MVREELGGPPEGPGVVGRLSRRSERGREALLKVRKSIPEVREGSGGPTKVPGGPLRGPGGVWRPSRKFARVL